MTAVRASSTPHYTPTRRAPSRYRPGPSLQAAEAGNYLRMGHGGPSVSDVQRQLNAAGINPPLAVDGKFGPKTDAALRAFQQRNGLQVDGLVGPETLGALRNGASMESGSATRDRSAARSAVGNPEPEPRPQSAEPRSQRPVRVSPGLSTPEQTPPASTPEQTPPASTPGQTPPASTPAQTPPTPAQASPTDGPSPTAPVRTNPDANTGSQLEAFPIAGGRYNIGYDREWNNFDPSTARHNSDFSATRPTNASHPNGHQGVDIFAPRGQPVVSPVSGEVESVRRGTNGSANSVTIRRGNTRFYMTHLDSIPPGLQPGQQITAGTPVGTVGNTGAQTTAPHLHFSIYEGRGGYRTNPINPFDPLQTARAQGLD